MLVHSNVRIIRYSNSSDRIVLFGIRYSLIFPDRIIFGIRYSLISRNEYYSIFGIRKFPGTNNIRYSVFGQNHYSWQLWEAAQTWKLALDNCGLSGDECGTLSWGHLNLPQYSPKIALLIADTH